MILDLRYLDTLIDTHKLKYFNPLSAFLSPIPLPHPEAYSIPITSHPVSANFPNRLRGVVCMYKTHFSTMHSSDSPLHQFNNDMLRDFTLLHRPAKSFLPATIHHPQNQPLYRRNEVSVTLQLAIHCIKYSLAHLARSPCPRVVCLCSIYLIFHNLSCDSIACVSEANAFAKEDNVM